MSSYGQRIMLRQTRQCWDILGDKTASGYGNYRSRSHVVHLKVLIDSDMNCNAGIDPVLLRRSQLPPKIIPDEGDKTLTNCRIHERLLDECFLNIRECFGKFPQHM